MTWNATEDQWGRTPEDLERVQKKCAGEEEPPEPIQEPPGEPIPSEQDVKKALEELAPDVIESGDPGALKGHYFLQKHIEREIDPNAQAITAVG